MFETFYFIYPLTIINLPGDLKMRNIVINGVGTIGKRVAEAVKKQEDMKLYAVADVAPNPELKTIKKNFLKDTPLLATLESAVEDLENGGLEVQGTLEEHIDNIDLIVDATPKGIDEKNKENIYEPNDVKAIFQGGADKKVADVSFNADANYEEALGEDYVRVVSCNTTSLCRTLYEIDDSFSVNEVNVSLVRRGGDPKEDSRGPINSIVPVTDVPSHHGPDVKEVMPDIDITTLAVKVPTTLAHVHMVSVEIEGEASEEDIKRIFDKSTRISLLSAEEGYTSTAKITEKMRDMHRDRNDMNEVGVWEETITVEGDMVYWIHMTHQESIVVPETIDAIRAMLEMEENKLTSIIKTNKALGI